MRFSPWWWKLTTFLVSAHFIRFPSLKFSTFDNSLNKTVNTISSELSLCERIYILPLTSSELFENITSRNYLLCGELKRKIKTIRRNQNFTFLFSHTTLLNSLGSENYFSDFQFISKCTVNSHKELFLRQVKR